VRPDLAEEGKFQWLARFGFVVRGLLYILIASLVILTGRTEGLTGALKYLDRGVGQWLLAAVAFGMAGYGLWRLADAAFGMDSGRHSAKAWRRRIAAGFSGAIYLGLAYKAASLFFGFHVSDHGPQVNARTLLDLPSGQLMLFAAAAVLGGAALVQFYHAGTCSFLERLDDRAQAPWAKWMGRIGYASRGIVFAVVAYLLFKAAQQHSPQDAGGLEQALDALSGGVRYAVAVGLLVFGAYSIVEARFRSIRKPPVKHIKRKVEQTLTD
jgi:hypothetical protein